MLYGIVGFVMLAALMLAGAMVLARGIARCVGRWLAAHAPVESVEHMKTPRAAEISGVIRARNTSAGAVEPAEI